MKTSYILEHQNYVKHPAFKNTRINFVGRQITFNSSHTYMLGMLLKTKKI